MNIFVQKNFLGGMNTRTEPSKLSEGQYKLLINGRVYNNAIKPTRGHKRLKTPQGKKQGLYSAGTYLILFVDGLAWYYDITNQNPTWQAINSWPALSAGVGRIYATLVPVSYFNGSIKYDTNEISNAQIVSIPNAPAPTAQFMFVTDGVNPARAIYGDGTWREINNSVSNWTPEVPEYVPKGILPIRSGPKLYLVDPVDRTKIYHSVSGRFLDFVIDRGPSGEFGGDEQSTFKSVDYNAITALASLPGNSLFVGTLHSSYSVSLDYTQQLFAEPMLREEFLFPTGPINERVFADINGDLGFITQVGIQGFNITRQVRAESNNYPLGAPISEILKTPQTSAAAINFEQYALFALDTIHGPGVLVYDNTLETYVSLDLSFGQVIDFAVIKYRGTYRLFFLSADGFVYEAFADEAYNTCRIYLGDASTLEGGIWHRPRYVAVQFDNPDTVPDSDGAGPSGAIAQLTAYVDREEVFKESRRTPHVFVIPEAKYGLKSGYVVEWNSNNNLLSLVVEGDTLSRSSFAVPERYAITNPKFEVFALTNAMFPQATSLAAGAYYYIQGSITDGVGNKITNSIFKAATNTAFPVIQGILYKLENWRQPCSNIATLGNVPLYPTAIVNLPGRDDLDNAVDYFNNANRPAYYSQTFRNGEIEFFVAGMGYDNNDYLYGGDSIDDQKIWLTNALGDSKARFKIVLTHFPPYSLVRGYSEFVLPYHELGATAVISADTAYHRFKLYNLQYVNLPPFINYPFGHITSYDPGIYYALPGIYGGLHLIFDAYNLYIRFINSQTGKIEDVIQIYT